MHVGELEFGESTGRAQAQVGLIVAEPETGAPIGAVTPAISLKNLTNRGSGTACDRFGRRFHRPGPNRSPKWVRE